MTTPLPIRALLLSGLVFAGCVIPVSPEFEDAERNYPPFLITSNPSEADIFTQGTTGEDREIAVTLADHNLHDNLFVRWLVDYPGANMATSRPIREDILPPSGSFERSTYRIQPGCDSLGLTPGPHRLVLAVADRRFLDVFAGDSVSPEAPLDTPDGDGIRIRVVWTLNCSN
jgi:hypothetical protein